MFEMKDIKNIELPLENCKICGTPTNHCDIIFVPPHSKICGRCYAEFYKKQMNRYNAQILNYKGEYHLQFETNSRKNFDAMEKLAQKIIDKNPRTNFDKITESVESLAKAMIRTKISFSLGKCAYYTYYETVNNEGFSSYDEALSYTIEWLQKECEEC